MDGVVRVVDTGVDQDQLLDAVKLLPGGSSSPPERSTPPESGLSDGERPFSTEPTARNTSAFRSLNRSVSRWGLRTEPTNGAADQQRPTPSQAVWMRRLMKVVGLFGTLLGSGAVGRATKPDPSTPPTAICRCEQACAPVVNPSFSVTCQSPAPPAVPAPPRWQGRPRHGPGRRTEGCPDSQTSAKPNGAHGGT